MHGSGHRLGFGCNGSIFCSFKRKKKGQIENKRFVILLSSRHKSFIGVWMFYLVPHLFYWKSDELIQEQCLHIWFIADRGHMVNWLPAKNDFCSILVYIALFFSLPSLSPWNQSRILALSMVILNHSINSNWKSTLF